jgi:hypothetical protein
MDDTEIVDDKNRFNAIYRSMIKARWRITVLTMVTMMIFLLGISVSVAFGVRIAQEWKEILLLLLGALIGSYNRVIDHWFNNSQRDEKILEKMDQENDSDAVIDKKLSLMAVEEKTNSTK